LTVLEHKPGIEIVGTIPKEFAADILMSAAVPKSSPDAAAASQFIKFLKSPDAAAALKAHGMHSGRICRAVAQFCFAN
jgi:molybdate transport system substrate-binding protein